MSAWTTATRSRLRQSLRPLDGVLATLGLGLPLAGGVLLVLGSRHASVPLAFVGPVVVALVFRGRQVRPRNGTWPTRPYAHGREPVAETGATAYRLRYTGREVVRDFE